MNRPDNYAIQTRQAQARFLTYDQEEMIRKFRLEADSRYLYPRMLARRYRLDRTTGSLEKEIPGGWADANTFSQVLTLLDLLCDAREDRFLTGRFRTMQDFGLRFHTHLLEEARDPEAEAFDRDPEILRRGCLALGGVPFPGGDLGYAVELFDGLSIALQFWHGDEEFAPRLRYLWDENALCYLRYETMYYAVGLLLDRIREEAGNIQKEVFA